MHFDKEVALLREELRAKDSEVLKLKRHVREITSVKDSLQEKMALVVHQLHYARVDSDKYRGLHSELVAALFRIKTEVEVLISLHK